MNGHLKQVLAKKVKGTIQPSNRFDLNKGSSFQALNNTEKTKTNKEKQQFATMQVVAHPVLWSIPMANTDDSSSPLPVVEEGERVGVFFQDRYNENVRWYLPYFKTIKPEQINHEILRVRKLGLDEEGENTYAGLLKISLEKSIPETIKSEIEKNDKNGSKLSFREIPLDRLEAALHLPYHSEGKEKQIIKVKEIDLDDLSVTYELMGSSLKLAFNHIAKNGEAFLKITGQFDSWSPKKFNKDKRAKFDFLNMSPGKFLQVSQVKPTIRMKSRLKDKTKPNLKSSSKFPTAAHSIKLNVAKVGLNLRTKNPKKKKKSGASNDFQFLIQNVKAVNDQESLVTGLVQDGHIYSPATVDHIDNNGNVSQIKVTSIKRGSQSTGSAFTGSSVSMLVEHSSGSTPSKNTNFVHKGAAEVYVKQDQIYNVTHELDIPCNGFGDLYKIDIDGEERPFGCSPPWSSLLNAGSRYEKLQSDELDIDPGVFQSASVYRSLDELGAYMIVPAQYKIRRTVHDLAPAFTMISILDPEENDTSGVGFNIGIAPDLDRFDLLQIRHAVRRYQNQLFGTSNDPILKFPTSLSDLPETNWNGMFTNLADLISDGDTYLITLESESVSFATGALKSLKTKVTHLGGTLTFQLDEFISEESSIKLNLHDCGLGGLIYEIDSEQRLNITNNYPSPVTVSKIIHLDPKNNKLSLEELDNNIQIEAGKSTSAKIEATTEGLFAAKHHVTQSDFDSLSEIRVHVETLPRDIALDTDIQPHETFKGKTLKEIHVELVVKTIDKKKRIVLGAQENRFETAVFEVFLPLDKYIQPSSLELDYKPLFVFDDGTEIEGDWNMHLFGLNPNLTIRRQQLNNLI